MDLSRFPARLRPETSRLIAMLAAAAMLLGTAWMGDDAFITLRVIDNFVNGYGLRFNVIERVQVFTHPLWLVLLTPFYALTREAMVTTMLVSAGVSLAAFWVLGTRIGKDAAAGGLLVLLAVASRSISQYATSGLETPLTFLLLAWLVSQLQRAERYWVPAASIGLLLLNRLDLAVLLAPISVYLFIRARGTDRINSMLAASLPMLAWMGFSLVYYGMPLPNTAYAKLGNGYGAAELVWRGMGYVQDFALHDPLLLSIIAWAVFGALRSRDWANRSLGAGIVLYILYTIMIGGDFMSGRFFAAPGFVSLCLLARLPLPAWLGNRVPAAASAVFLLVIALFVARVAWQPMRPIVMPDSGIADEQHFYFADTGLLPVLGGWIMHGSEPVPWQGRRGQELKALAQRSGHAILVSAEAIGMRGYYGGPMVHVLDEVALADAFLARLPALPDSRVGHYQRALPPGYAASISSAAPATEDAALQPLLEDIVLATRAPVFAQGRWGAIGRLLSQRYAGIYRSGNPGMAQ